MHAYYDTKGTLPPAALYDRNGKPLLSWRVLLLPNMEQQELYNQFHLDEPWDSPHNLPLLSQMPQVYAPFNGKPTPRPYTTFYRVFVGPGAAFEGQKGMSLEKDFLDGTSNTLLIVEAAEAVPWTQPDELAYDPHRPLPQLGGLWPQIFLAALADGSVRSFNLTVSEPTLRAWITRNGGDKPGPDS